METMETCGVPAKKPKIVELLQALETQINTVMGHQVDINKMLIGDIPSAEGNSPIPVAGVSDSLSLLLFKLYELEQEQWAAKETLNEKLGSGTPL